MRLYNRPRYSAVYTIADGKRGILETVSMMRHIVNEYKKDPELRSLALSLIRDLPPKDEVGEIKAVFDFVQNKIRYVKDVWDVETVHTPDRLLELMQGDCDDKSVMLATLLESIGYKTMFKVTGYHGPEFEHVYVFVTGSNIAMHLDATEPDPAGWEPPNPTAELYVE